MSRSLVALLLAIPATALAHVSVASGAGTANVSQEIAFGVGHGCSGADTYAVKISIPPGLTNVRTETSDFGRATVEVDGVGNVTAATWQKADADLLPSDTAYYKLVIRAKLPNAPFTSLFFPTRQTCKSSTGTLTVVDWVGTTVVVQDGGPQVEPAPQLRIVPARKPGWNKYAPTAAIADVSIYFADAQILWRGTEAYSSNPETVAQLEKTSGVTRLTGGVSANQEIWVKY